MNQQQRKYAAQRLQQLFNEKMESIKKTHTIQAIRLTCGEKTKALENNEVVFTMPTVWPNSAYDILKCFEWKGEQGASINKTAIEEESKPLTKRYQEALDELYLGDSEVALSLITEFSLHE